MLVLEGVHKTYAMGTQTVRALQGVDLQVSAGEFVAIMGPSGSGKSTLLQILGLLDTPDSGAYKIDGVEVSHFSEDQLAELRRKRMGFVFQQFHLLPKLTALQNVDLPFLYSRGRPNLTQSLRTLEQVGLGERAHHRPNELSGGQQQRVAIARALVNSPTVLLADEPTGNLDSQSELEIMRVLSGLNASGITVIMVTHEDEIAKYASRIIRMRDGRIQSDIRQQPKLSKDTVHPSPPHRVLVQPPAPSEWGIDYFLQNFMAGVHSLVSNRIRSGLSMLGILIGVAAVIAMLAVGRGAQKAIEKQMSFLGSNLLSVRSGAAHGPGGARLDAGSAARLSWDDGFFLKTQISGIQDVSAVVMGRGQVSFEDRNWSTSFLGVDASYAWMRSATPEVGRFFTVDENRKRSRVALVGATVVRELFRGQDPVGKTIKINRTGFQVVGMLPERGANSYRDQDDVVVLPVFTAMYRVLGKEDVDSLDVEIEKAEQIPEVQKRILDVLYTRHNVPLSQRQNAYEVRNMADLQSALSASTETMTSLLSIVALISLLVGGIGIMNILLVSVSERTREIGLRKAVGAKARDIAIQFLIESVVISLTGGFLGIASGWGAALTLAKVAGWSTSVSWEAVALAAAFSIAIGLIFGIYPATRAARLSPIRALRWE